MKQNIEYRTYSREVRLEETEASRTLKGYAVVWNTPSQDLGGYYETVVPNAFGDIQNKDIRAFFNHDYNYLLGRTTSNSLRLWQDETGLGFEIDLAPTAKGEEVYQLVKRGDLDGVSFGAIVLEEQWSEDGSNNALNSMELIEISPVVFPAFLQPNVSARSVDRMSERPKPRNQYSKYVKLMCSLD